MAEPLNLVSNPGPGAPPAQGTVTSVSGSGGTTGLTLTGGPITLAGTLELGGELVAEHGGTGFDAAYLADKAWNTLRVNGAGDGIIADASPYPMNITFAGVMDDTQLICFNPSPLPFSLPENLAGSRIVALSGATAETIVTLYKNGVEFGTLTWAAAGTVPTIVSDAVSFNGTTDTLTIYGPPTHDDTLGNIGMFILGERTG